MVSPVAENVQLVASSVRDVVTRTTVSSAFECPFGWVNLWGGSYWDLTNM